LDFNNFVITGPVTATASFGSNGNTFIKRGQLNSMGVLSASLVSQTNCPINCYIFNSHLALQAGQCLTDTFVVSNPGGVAPPLICGTNTGEHSKKAH